MNEKNFPIVMMIIVFIVGFGIAWILRSPASMGGLVHNAMETFTQGIRVGDPTVPACFIVEDTDKGGYSYITYLDGVETVTGGAAGAFVIPDACKNK